MYRIRGCDDYFAPPQSVVPFGTRMFQLTLLLTFFNNELLQKHLTSQSRTQGLSSWGENTLVDTGHMIC
jgi:hypothetical protein